MPTPSWLAARNGLPGDSNAVDKSAQINQFLGAHGVTPIYKGSAILTPTGQNESPDSLQKFDEFQPFVMSGTTIGRITIPVTPIGAGADLKISLCADSGGNPGTVIASVRIPAKWITTFAAVPGLPSTQPLQVAQFNTLRVGTQTQTTFQAPATSATGTLANPQVTVGGNYVIFVGGGDSVSGGFVPNVFTLTYGGGSQLGTPVPQPPLPQAAGALAVTTTPDALVVAGGQIGPSTFTSDVYVATWNPNTGQVSSWSQQGALPQALASCAAASSGETVYVVGGSNSGGTAQNTVYYATLNNGQLSAWNTTSFPGVGLDNPIVGVVGGMLIIAGGTPTSGTASSAVYYAPINPDGSLGTWQTGPSMPVGVAYYQHAISPAGIVAVLGFTNTTGGTTNAIQTLTMTPNGPGEWQQLASFYVGGALPSFLLPSGNGTWQAFALNATTQFGFPILSSPRISVPLPVSGLTNGATYHVLFQQQGGDGNNYIGLNSDVNALPTPYKRAPRGTTTWTAVSGWEIPIYVYDQTPGGPVLHTWEDSGNRITTPVWATTPDARLLGVAEATQFADGTLLAEVASVNYPGTWPAGAWPPIGVTQL